MTATHFWSRGGISALTCSRCWPRSTPKVFIFLRSVLGPHRRCSVSRHFLWHASPHSVHSYPLKYAYLLHSRQFFGVWIF